MTSALCHQSTGESVLVPLVQIIPGMMMFLLAILSWGALIESRMPKESRSWAHAFLSGTVVVSLLRYVFHLFGWVNSSWWIAIFGVLSFGVLGYLKKDLFFRYPHGLNWKAPSFLGLVLAPVLYYTSHPQFFGDMTAIWVYHAKALTCEALLDADYVRERHWTGTHPNYPLYLSLLHSTFFELTNSFRDDWAKLWQAISIACFSWLGGRAVYGYSKSKALGVVASALFWVVACQRAQDAKVEVHSFIFSGLIAISFLKNEFARLPLYFFGLAFTKNEGMVFAGLMMGLMGLYLLREFFSAAQIKLSQSGLPYLGASLALIAIWWSVQKQLPDEHVPYGKLFWSSEAWQGGIIHIEHILRNMLQNMGRWPWPMIFFPSLIVFLFSLARNRKEAVPMLASWLMVGIFLMIYVITTWGPDLYRITIHRLYFGISAPLAVGIFWFIGREFSQSGFRLRFAQALTVLLAFIYGEPFLNYQFKWTKGFYDGVTENRLGFSNYQSTPEWKRAFKLDSKLPLKARVAILNEREYFDLNYTLYPRKLYSGLPESRQGAKDSDPIFKNLNDVPVELFQHVTEGDRLILRSE